MWIFKWSRYCPRKPLGQNHPCTWSALHPLPSRCQRCCNRTGRRVGCSSTRQWWSWRKYWPIQYLCPVEWIIAYIQCRVNIRCISGLQAPQDTSFSELKLHSPWQQAHARHWAHWHQPPLPAALKEHQPPQPVPFEKCINTNALSVPPTVLFTLPQPS